MFILIDELKTHLAAENIELISGNDDTVITAAIDGAIAEAKSYFGGYDATTIFNKTGSNRNALLVIFVKDIAMWHFLTLCNAGAEMELREKRYLSAIAWLKGVQKGEVTPDLPTKTVTEETPGVISYGSNTKRNNHF